MIDYDNFTRYSLFSIGLWENVSREDTSQSVSLQGPNIMFSNFEDTINVLKFQTFIPYFFA